MKTNNDFSVRSAKGQGAVVGDASKRRSQRNVTLGGVTHYNVTLGGVTHYVRRAAAMLLTVIMAFVGAQTAGATTATVTI